ncbi:DUF421 domain-containing protein [Pseudalkalibacillus berkeleyi]|uniref:DUF421 domain-containing protein n=1 Tax=Pseudalkalibacillus berkeleyi TaxID=1069813 RepID=A0ABS9GXK9_9BACL|nr:DUF421 domain-containing protein [Pseudalkalibacillus berkeleyi]MCF6136105.1 DUF421 domain-containing protein [Pseudalkalibacillus berkeleyi]
MELAKDLLILLGRVVTILPLLLVVALFMGKRSIGELPVFDLLILLTLGSVVGADIAEPDVVHIHTIAAIILIGLLQKLVAIWKIKNRKFGKLVTFEPTVVIQDGSFIIENLKNMQYSIDNILLMLREKDVFDITHVKLGIIEANGQLTVLRKPEKSPVTIEDLKLNKPYVDLAYPLIVEGKLYHDVLNAVSVNEKWLRLKLEDLGITDYDDVFFASVDEQKNLHVSLKSLNAKSAPPIYH